MKQNTFLLVSIFLFLGCGHHMSPSDYEAIVKSACIGVPIAGQIEEIFGDADHFISRLGMGDEIWNTEVFFGGRYSLTMQVEVNVNYSKKTVKQVGQPKFYVAECTEIMITPSGMTGAKLKPVIEGPPLDAKQWIKIYEKRGDFSVLGVTLNEEPLPNFEKYVKNIRKDRIPISLLK
ncbi:MAG: hypothetical protein ACKVT0_19780 [Planctomycetaceae bacterium]